MQILSLVAQIRAKPGKEKQLEGVLRALLQPTRAEPGCITYDLHQGREEPDLFVLYENWETVPLWQDHMGSPHIEAFKARSDELVADWKLLQLTRLT
jgi:quinol monooxygenase YgiN